MPTAKEEGWDLPSMSGTWWVYMIECRGGKIYTGIAKDPDARFRRHRAGNGAAFTRMNPPLTLLAKRPCGTRADALGAERVLKRLTGVQKRAWAEMQKPFPGRSVTGPRSVPLAREKGKERK